MSNASVATTLQLLTLSEVVQSLAAVGSVECIFSEEAYFGVARTAFCHTTIPNSIVLAMSTDWLTMAVESPNVSCVVTTPEVFTASRIGDSPCATIITMCSAAEAFYYLHNQALHESAGALDDNIEPRIADDAQVASSAILDGPVILESGVRIGHQVVLEGPVHVGQNTRIDAQCAIGVEGLFTKLIGGRRTHVRHYGGVHIGANAHLYAGCNVARAVNVFEQTWLGDNVSVGPRSVVGHDSFVGDGSTISTQAAIMGRARVGPGCWVGAGALISNSIGVGEESSVRIGAVVLRDVPARGDVSGNFAVSHSVRLREFVRTEDARPRHGQ